MEYHSFKKKIYATTVISFLLQQGISLSPAIGMNLEEDKSSTQNNNCLKTLSPQKRVSDSKASPSKKVKPLLRADNNADDSKQITDLKASSSEKNFPQTPILPIANHAPSTGANLSASLRANSLVPQVTAIKSSVGSQPPNASSSTNPIYDQFKRIMALSPVPVSPVISQITVVDEEREGSRKWVKSFNEQDGVKDWHKEMTLNVCALRNENTSRQILPDSTNFVLARLVFVLKNGERRSKEIPFIFASGFPSNDNKKPAKEFSKLIQKAKISDNLKQYGLKFITMTFKDGKKIESEDRKYDTYQNNLKEIFEKERKEGNPIPGTKRLETHLKIMTTRTSETSAILTILPRLYFHSEQTIRITIKDEIDKYREELNGNIQNGVKNSSDPIDYIFLDISSFYDMCWCCGDALASGCHTKTFGVQLYVRASGYCAHHDLPFPGSIALRDQRKQFQGYNSGGNGFIFQAEGDPNSYRPFIAHSTARDWE